MRPINDFGKCRILIHGSVLNSCIQTAQPPNDMPFQYKIETWGIHLKLALWNKSRTWCVFVSKVYRLKILKLISYEKESRSVIASRLNTFIAKRFCFDVKNRENDIYCELGAQYKDDRYLPLRGEDSEGRASNHSLSASLWGNIWIDVSDEPRGVFGKDNLSL